MRKSRKKWVTWLIVSAIMALSVMIGSVSLAATDLSSEVYLAQQGSSTCTLASAAMMIRARFYKSNNSLWKSVTESSIRSKAWIEGSGLRHSWSYSIDNNSVSVAHSTVSGISVSSLKSLLNSHPEGIVLYCGKLPHAVFLTDYDGDTFYCADPIQSYSGKRISLAASYLGKKYGSQAGVLNNVTAYWYISSYKILESGNSYYNSYGFDAPSSNGTITESTFLFQGWIDAKKKISTITCSINHGTHYVEAALYKRPDVPNATAFRVEANSNLLKTGKNDVALCVNFADGTATVVENRSVTWSPKLIWGYDSPTDGMKIVDNQFQFSGWIESARKLDRVTCSLNQGEKYLTASLYKRPDVPNATAFRLDIDTSNLHYGDNYVSVCAHYADGTSQTIAMRKVRRCISDAIEYPQNNEKFTCKNPKFLLQGWSMNDSKAIDHFAFTINGTKFLASAHTRSDLSGNARYYREEVLLGRLKNGNNKIEIFAYYTDGTSRNIGQVNVVGDIDHKWDTGKVTQLATCTKTGIKLYTCTNCKTTKKEAIPATGKHQNTELRNKKEATCTAEGYTGDTYCKDCGTKLQTGKAIAKKAHTWDAGKITQEATCAKIGIKTYTCTVCKTTKTENIPATGNHKNTELRNAKEATCTVEGYTGDTYCKDCGTKLQTGKAIAKKSHTWDAGKITQEATCAKTGIKTYTCTVCKTTKTEEVPATGNHKNTELRNAKEATCTAEGYTGDTYCKDCGAKLQTGKAIAKKAHTWDAGKITQEATCVKTGIKTYTCTVCKTTKTEGVSATGNHKNTELRNAKEATCTAEGYTGDTYCKDCGAKLQTGKAIAKKAHTWDAGKITQEATCAKAGIKTYTCTVCKTTKTEEVPATGTHKNTELRNVKEATCTAEGYTGDTYCKDCGAKLQTGKAIAKKAHTWDAGKITQEATCAKTGIKTYTCTVCKTTKTEEVPATGVHKNTELRNVKEATCTEEGYTGDTYCKDCGNKIASGQKISKIEHSWNSGIVTTPPTCVEHGVKTYTCNICQTTKTEELPATGNHQNTELRNTKEASCTAEGYTGDIYCKDCGTKLQTGKTIAKKAHTWDAGVITTPASCTEKGIKTYTCTSCGGTKTNELPSTGHKQKEVRNKKAATCMQSGYTGDTYCKDCGKKLSSGKAIAKLAHKWDAGVITQEATCTEAGIRTYMCTVCESTKIEEIPANGHGETVTKFAKEATCKMEGYTGDLYCMDCGELLEEGSVIEKLPHQWDAGKITKKATTTTTGIRTYTCTKCGATKKETIPKIVSKKATPGKTVKDSATNGIYKVLADGLTVTFVRPAAKRATVRIPETVKVSGVTCKVTEISENAFKNDAVLKTVVIGKNVKTIGVNAFYGCKNLTKVSGGAALVTICDRAFSNCAALQGIVLPSTVKGIGKQAFYNCKKLRSITINTLSLTSKNVGAQAFTGTYAKAVVKVPAKKFAAYKSLLRAKGMNAGAIYTK